MAAEDATSGRQHAVQGVVRLRRAHAFVLAALLLGACGGPATSAQDVVDAFVDAGLPAPNPRDVTESACAPMGCEEAVQTDVVTVFRWGESSQAIAHAADLKQPAYSLNEFVIAFPADTDTDTAPYARALQNAADGGSGS